MSGAFAADVSQQSLDILKIIRVDVVLGLSCLRRNKLEEFN